MAWLKNSESYHSNRIVLKLECFNLVKINMAYHLVVYVENVLFQYSPVRSSVSRVEEKFH